MNIIFSLHVLLAAIFLLCIKTSSYESEPLSKYDNLMTCIERERKALLMFKQSVAGGRHDLLYSWLNNGEDCCTWEGVGCDNRTGHVTHLHLSSLISPSYINKTSVSFGHSLLDLPFLKYLDLSCNFLVGIPEFIGSLTKLVHPDFSLTYAEGSIPGHMGNLQYLNLSFNYFDGPIPLFVGSFKNLRYLDLSNNKFSGVIPHELRTLSKLLHLDLSNNLGLISGENFEWLFNQSSLIHLDLSGISITPPSIWTSFIERIPSILYMRLGNCNLSSPSLTFSNFSSSLSILHLRGNYINSSIFNWLSRFSESLLELDLGNNMLEGKIPQSFGQMTALNYLDLSANELNGVPPLSIRNLSNLKVLDISANNFTGNLEDLLFGPFSLLHELLISENQLTGSLPDITLLSSLKKLGVSSNHLNGCLPTVFKHHSALEILDLSNNHLRGSLPNFTGFSSLIYLTLYNNGFSGSLPDFTGCSSLQVLYLGENQLTKWETQSIGLLSSLEELDLSKNSICSTISEAHLSNVSSLMYMCTSSNSLTFEFSSNWIPPFQLRLLSLASCKLGPKFPNWIRNQEYIDHLDISNTQISDALPIWLWNLSSGMRLLNLSSNNITGKLFWKYVNIQEIDLSSNYIDGPLPKLSAECLKINLSQNKFSGTLISLSVVEDLSLKFLDISHNHLFGSLPDKWMHFQDLVFLNLGYNNFSGRMPTSLGHLVSLRTLILRNNRLCGALPASLRNCSSLGFVDFGLNKLSGEVPSWIGQDLPQLYALILKFNRFNGSLPYEICHLSNLHFLDLSINKISGTIPSCFGNLSSMVKKGSEVSQHIYSALFPFKDVERARFKNLKAPSYSYFDNVLARWKGQEFEYGRNFAYLKMIDLSTNKLTGEIPEGITRLLELKGLNLSGNTIYGNVPWEIGQLKVLECLDLSANKFSGEIPGSLSGLNFLAYLDLSDNYFSGRIPSGTQLQGFSVSTYEGNPGLCGKPLTNICPGDEPANHIHPSSGKYEIEGDDIEYKRWLYISAALGFSTSFWGFIGILVLNRHWRRAYFMFLYNIGDQFYVAMAVHIARFQRTG